jgi:flap endonuclease-1
VSVLTKTQVYAAGSEDMDTLTFSSPILYRRLTFSEAKKAPISEINLQKALEGLEMDMSQVWSICALIGAETQVSQVYRPLYIAWLRLP